MKIKTPLTKEEVKDIRSGRTEWSDRKGGKYWYQEGICICPEGLALIRLEATKTTIRAVVDSREIIWTMRRQITPMSATKQARKILKAS